MFAVQGCSWGSILLPPFNHKELHLLSTSRGLIWQFKIMITMIPTIRIIYFIVIFTVKGVNRVKHLGQKVRCLVSRSFASWMEPWELHVSRSHPVTMPCSSASWKKYDDSAPLCCSYILSRWDSQCIERAKSNYVSNASNGKKQEPIRYQIDDIVSG